tara:strand:+ start:660 stop:1004 length:345 start_codon:yes stop_codon:yes gene_type:complete
LDSANRTGDICWAEPDAMVRCGTNYREPDRRILDGTRRFTWTQPRNWIPSEEGMEENFGGMTRLINNLSEEVIELEVAGMYDEAEGVRERLQTYRDMRNKAHLIRTGLFDDRKR